MNAFVKWKWSCPRSPVTSSHNSFWPDKKDWENVLRYEETTLNKSYIFTDLRFDSVHPRWRFRLNIKHPGIYNSDCLASPFHISPLSSQPQKLEILIHSRNTLIFERFRRLFGCHHFMKCLQNQVGELWFCSFFFSFSSSSSSSPYSSSPQFINSWIYESWLTHWLHVVGLNCDWLSYSRNGHKYITR
jgi:hypothetical protein